MHDFKLFKTSGTKIHSDIALLLDSGYQGIHQIHKKSTIPIKRKKKAKLTTEEKEHNRNLASQRVKNENIIGVIKRFKIISDKYRNRRKRFGLRFNLIAGFCNREIKL